MPLICSIRFSASQWPKYPGCSSVNETVLLDQLTWQSPVWASWRIISWPLRITSCQLLVTTREITRNKERCRARPFLSNADWVQREYELRRTSKLVSNIVKAGPMKLHQRLPQGIFLMPQKGRFYGIKLCFLKWTGLGQHLSSSASDLPCV